MIAIEPFKSALYVTQPLLPELGDVNTIIKEIWESKQLTNNGKMVARLEEGLGKFLGADNLSVFSNGTIALQLAYRLLDLSGEVITTPFTFAATVNSLVWNNLKPVFCDIEEETLNIDTNLIESLITKDTTAIMPVHVFGNPCNVEKIKEIADKHGLKVIYDAAHAFGVKIDGKPISAFGDVSMLSFHATKVYHTIEGGALCYKSPELKQKADLLRNFGLKENGDISDVGINAKMNEVQAGIGILLLDMIEDEIRGRKKAVDRYRNLLKDVPGISFNSDISGVTHNYSYFVIRVDREGYGISRDELHERLKEYNVITRKYFYPVCSNFQCYKDLPSASKDKLPVSNRVGEEVLSLPLHGRMELGDIDKICAIIKEVSL